jgi:hypothetical protein
MCARESLELSGAHLELCTCLRQRTPGTVYVSQTAHTWNCVRVSESAHLDLYNVSQKARCVAECVPLCGLNVWHCGAECGTLWGWIIFRMRNVSETFVQTVHQTNTFYVQYWNGTFRYAPTAASHSKPAFCNDPKYLLCYTERNFSDGSLFYIRYDRNFYEGLFDQMICFLNKQKLEKFNIFLTAHREISV